MKKDGRKLLFFPDCTSVPANNPLRHCPCHSHPRQALLHSFHFADEGIEVQSPSLGLNHFQQAHPPPLAMAPPFHTAGSSSASLDSAGPGPATELTSLLL